MNCLYKTQEELDRLNAIWNEIEEKAEPSGSPEPKTQAELDEERRKATINRIASLERKEFLSNVKANVGNGAFHTKWEKILSQFIMNNMAPMNTEINTLRNFANAVSERLEKAERSAKEQDNHHYYKIFAEGVRQLLEKL